MVLCTIKYWWESSSHCVHKQSIPLCIEHFWWWVAPLEVNSHYTPCFVWWSLANLLTVIQLDYIWLIAKLSLRVLTLPKDRFDDINFTGLTFAVFWLDDFHQSLSYCIPCILIGCPSLLQLQLPLYFQGPKFTIYNSQMRVRISNLRVKSFVTRKNLPVVFFSS